MVPSWYSVLDRMTGIHTALLCTISWAKLPKIWVSKRAIAYRCWRESTMSGCVVHWTVERECFRCHLSTSFAILPTASVVLCKICCKLFNRVPAPAVDSRLQALKLLWILKHSGSFFNCFRKWEEGPVKFGIESQSRSQWKRIKSWWQPVTFLPLEEESTTW